MALPFTDVELRAYFASVVGAFRIPYGKRSGGLSMDVGKSAVLAINSTKERVLSVTVTRKDLTGAAADVIFSTQQTGSANDFNVRFVPAGRERFVLMPGDQLSVSVIGGGPASFVVGQETF